MDKKAGGKSANAKKKTFFYFSKSFYMLFYSIIFAFPLGYYGI